MSELGTQQPGRPGRGGRDRHGRGLRGPLTPPQVPLARSRSDRFDAMVLDAVEALESRWRTELSRVEFAVEDVPPPAPGAPATVPLGRAFPAGSGRPARVVVYRRPVELRAGDAASRADLVRDVVVECVADLLGLSPEQVDPGYGVEED